MTILLAPKVLVSTRVAADGQERFVDFLNHLRPGEVEHLGDVLLAHPVAVQIEGANLKVGPHRAVEDDDAPAGKFEKW